jgi:hypothetical protein
MKKKKPIGGGEGGGEAGATMNQHPPVHHPLDTHYYSVVDEPQPS